MGKWRNLALVGALSLATGLLAACSGSNGLIATSQPTVMETVQPSETGTPSPATSTPSPTSGVSPSPEATSSPGDGSSDNTLDASAVITISAVDTTTGDVIVGGYVKGVKGGLLGDG